jgi:alginate O-acetyltransferase complex protein AlgI
MVFSSIPFLGLFLPVVLLAYQLGGAGWKNGVLLVASLLFYAWGEPRYVVLLLISVAMNFHFGMAVYRRTGASRRRMLAVAIAANLLPLGVLKYANFGIDNINTALLAFGTATIEHVGGKLPIGISFYTFHAISYLVDISRRNVEPNRSLTQFSLYIMLFPQLVAGPIIRYKDIWGQLSTRCASLDAVSHGVLRFVVGLSKKVLLANALGAVADDAFSEPASGLDPANAWFGLLCYALQIYFDFSGYSDMAVGLANHLRFLVIRYIIYH